MSKKLPTTKPSEFGLASFADLISRRDSIPGEAPLVFQAFHSQIFETLLPVTPYEAVIAENLIAIEWELLQHRRMRDATLRSEIKSAISRAVEVREKAFWTEQINSDRDVWVAAGNAEEDFAFDAFDGRSAFVLGENLAQRLLDQDPKLQSNAEAELIELGLDALQLMGIAYRSNSGNVAHHDDKIQDLERRRRQVKADLDSLQKSRPMQGEVIEG